jgi:hypothetical protein
MSVNPYPAANTGGPNNTPNHPSSGQQPWHRWQDWINLLLGVWLFVAPWIWHSTTASAASATASGWNAWVLGVIIVVMALWALASPATVAPEWINAIAGVWLFIAPWVLGYHRISASSAWNQWSVGVIVFILAVWAANTLGGMRHSGPRAA